MTKSRPKRLVRGRSQVQIVVLPPRPGVVPIDPSECPAGCCIPADHLTWRVSIVVPQDWLRPDSRVSPNGAVPTYVRVNIMAATPQTTKKNGKRTFLDQLLQELPPDLRDNPVNVIVRPLEALKKAVEERKKGGRSLRPVAKALGVSEDTLQTMIDGKGVRRDGAVRIVLGLKIKDLVTFMADPADGKDAPQPDPVAAMIVRQFDTQTSVPTPEEQAAFVRAVLDPQTLETMKEVWKIKEENRHKEASAAEAHRHKEDMADKLFKAAAEQLRLATNPEFEGQLNRLLDRFFTPPSSEV